MHEKLAHWGTIDDYIMFYVSDAMIIAFDYYQGPHEIIKQTLKVHYGNQTTNYKDDRILFASQPPGVSRHTHAYTQMTTGRKLRG